MKINSMPIMAEGIITNHTWEVQRKKRTWLLILSCFSVCLAEDAVALHSIDHLHNKLQMHLIQHNTLKSNSVSFTGSSVEKLNILLPLIFHPSFGLSVVLGTRRKAGGWGWSGVRETVKRLLNYSLLSVESAEWENCPRGEERSRRSNRFMAGMICFACLHCLELAASTINEMHLRKTKPCAKSWHGRVKATLPCSLSALGVAHSICFHVSFCLIKNFTLLCW